MKKLLAVAVASFSIGFFASPSERTAEAYPGMMCVDSSICGRCEVCVKDSPASATGKCAKIAGCN